MSVLDDYKKLLPEIRAGKFKPAYLLHGEEAYFIDRVAQEIERHALQEHEHDFDLTILYGRDTNAEQVRDACLRYPMMAAHHVVILREAQTWRPDQWDKLEPYVKNPSPTTILVIGHKHKKVDGRKGFTKSIGKTGIVFQSDKLREEKLPAWIQAFVKHSGRSISVKEAQLLADHLGSDLGKVTGEVEKLCLVCEPGGTVTADLIQRYVGISKEFNVFELQNALGARDRLKAQRIAHYFAQDAKDHPLVLTLGSLNTWCGKLALVHAGVGMDQNALAASLKVPPFFVRDYVQQARNFTPVQLRRVQHHLRDCDLRSKGLGSASASDGELLQELIERMLE